MAKVGPKIKWTEKRVKALSARIMQYARQAFDRQGEMKGLNFVGPTMPSLAECFKKNRISSSTVYELQKIYPELTNAIKKVKDAQEYLLTNYTLKGGYASTFAIFAAKNMIGWRDEQKGPVIDQSKHTHFTAVLDGQPSTNGDGKTHSEAESRIQTADQS